MESGNGIMNNWFTKSCLVIKIISFYFFNIDIVQPFSHKARLINLLTTWVTFLPPAPESGPASEQCGQQPDR